MTGSKKLKTSAFTEGIREITLTKLLRQQIIAVICQRDRVILLLGGRSFTLHGTRLSYFTSLKDKRKRGLIDITAHKVIPINSEAEDIDKADKYAAMVASTTMAGNYCFKLVPPAPGF